MKDQNLQSALTQDVELNRRSDAWIPRQATSQILSGIASSAPGASYPDRSALTAPAAAIRDHLQIMSAVMRVPLKVDKTNTG